MAYEDIEKFLHPLHLCYQSSVGPVIHRERLRMWAPEDPDAEEMDFVRPLDVVYSYS